MNLRSEKGSIDGELILGLFYLFLIFVFIGLVIFKTVYSRTAGNKTVIDLKYKYDKAIISINNEKMEIDVDSWSDYDGEIMFAFYNLGTKSVTIEKGYAIGQGIFQKYYTTDDDNAIGNRIGGFGSTNVV